MSQAEGKWQVGEGASDAGVEMDRRREQGRVEGLHMLLPPITTADLHRCTHAWQTPPPAPRSHPPPPNECFCCLLTSWRSSPSRGAAGLHIASPGRGGRGLRHTPTTGIESTVRQLETTNITGSRNNQ
jgi:hypothetical protein